MTFRFPPAATLAAGFAFFGLALLAPAPAAAANAAPRHVVTGGQESGGVHIVAVVNGTVITNQDVAARARLFALSAGMHPTAEVLGRLRPQITRELIDQALQLQAIKTHKVVVSEQRLEQAIEKLDSANNLPKGGLRHKVEAAGVPFSTLVNQFRIQIGWTDVLKKELGDNLRPTPEDVAAQKRALHREIGQTQYHVAEIFIPVEQPQDEASAKKFAQTVIGQLRAGAPFPLIAAQFSQSQSALVGGNRGWVAPDLIDPSVRAVVQRMPAGAITDAVRVPGGFEIVQLLGKRQFGEQTRTVLSIRQVFLPFPSKYAGGQPSQGQLQVVEKANALRKSLHSCAAVEAANKRAGAEQKSNPGPVDLGTVRPKQFHDLLAGLQPGQVSKPLVSHDGVALVMLCNSKTVKEGLPDDKQIRDMLIQRRVSLESQQLMDALRREAVIQRFAGR